MQEIKNTVTEMKISFNGFISELNMAEERISELEDISIETSNIKKKRKTEKKKTGILKDFGTTTKSIHVYNGNIRRGKKGIEEILKQK